MEIKILGTGCANCNKLEENTKKALEELKSDAAVSKVTEIQDIVSYGVLSTPALVIDEKVVVSGAVPGVSQIKELIKDNTRESSESAGCQGCSCGGDC